MAQKAPRFLTPEEAAQFKGVTRSAVYKAIAQGRLAHTRILGRLALQEKDVEAWTPVKFKERPGRPGGRAPGTRLSPEARARMSEAHKRRWAMRKQKQENP